MDIRLSDLLAALSVVTDLGMGHPPDEAMRACLLATALARTMDLSDAEVSDVYYTALLQHLGCSGYAHETAALWGDDVLLNAAGWRSDFFDPRDVLRTFVPAMAGNGGLTARVRVAAVAMTRGASFGKANNLANCEVGASTARRLGLSEGVQEALYQIYERWNGKGEPRRLAGEDIALPSRVALLAGIAATFQALGGAELAVDAVRRRAGSYLDPGLVDQFLRHADAVLAEAADGDAWEAVVAAEPEPRVAIGPGQVDTVARAFADLVDLKSPFTSGHSAGTAELAEEAAKRLGLGDVAGVRRAALLHDLGSVGVSSGIWDRRGALGSAEWEQVRLHAYSTERILSRSPILAPLARIAGMHHERLDGTGYHRGSSGGTIPAAARVLAAADAYQAMTQDRPHRPAFSPEAAAKQLASEAAAGRLDTEAADAVLAAAGQQRKPVRRSWPAGLSDRQVEVLRLMAEGLSNREIGGRLVISSRTAEHHVQDIYTKLGVSSRAAAALFAMEHDLIR